ncbi:MAG: hypothetical protein VB091_06445 [Christensenella sp.]|nr:hypothetical protein [Christensenella sp.]
MIHVFHLLMDYWPGVDAPSKKDVSGSEYITRTRMMQGVFVEPSLHRHGIVSPELDKRNSDGLIAASNGGTMIQDEKRYQMVSTARRNRSSAGEWGKLEWVKQYREIQNIEARFDP